MVACGRNSTSHNHCAIDRSICVRWHGVHQFLARRNIHGTFKQTGSRYSSRQLCHYVMAGRFWSPPPGGGPPPDPFCSFSCLVRPHYITSSRLSCPPPPATPSPPCRPL